MATKKKYGSYRTSYVDRDIIGEPLRMGINPIKRMQEQVDGLSFLEIEEPPKELTIDEELVNTLMSIPKIPVRKLNDIINETKREENYTDSEFTDTLSNSSKEKNEMLKAVFSNLELWGINV